MKSIFSELPNDIIIKIIRIDTARRLCHRLSMKGKYDEVINQINRISTEDEFCPSIRETVDMGCDGYTLHELWFSLDGLYANEFIF